MSQSGEEAKISLGAFQDATSEEKPNKAVELALQHHNEAAAQAAMRIAFLKTVVKQFEDTPLRAMLTEITDDLQEGYHASNSHGGRFLRDHLVKEHVIKGQNQAPQGFIDRLLGKKADQAG